MTENMHVVRRGSGTPLLLVHGLGSSWANWQPVLDALAEQREVIAVDLPGFGESPPLPGPVTIATLTDAVQRFLAENDLDRVDTVGSSMGARMVLELARRGVGGNAVALDPGGFWSPAQRAVFGASVRASVALVRALQKPMPVLTRSAVGRTLLLSQFSAHPWRLPADVVLTEMRSFAAATSLDEALDDLIHGPSQEGAPSGTLPGRVAIGWGRRDRVTVASQTKVALERFPDATLHWFDSCGHYPHWDQPEQTAAFILDSVR